MGRRHTWHPDGHGAYRNGCRQVHVTCPFYRDYTVKTIDCEGFMAGTGVTVRFDRREDCLRHMEVFCYEHNKNCEIYRMVMDARYAD